MEKRGIIYKATFSNGKLYIGQTTGKLNKRINKHIKSANSKRCNEYNTKMGRAIRKYGRSNIKWEVIFEDIDQEELDELEVKTIAKFDSKRAGYNSTDGGNGCKGFKHTEESKGRMSRSQKKRFKEDYNYQRGENNNCAKLDWETVNKIRIEYCRSFPTFTFLANKFDISRGTIRLVIKNLTWVDKDYTDMKKIKSDKSNKLRKEIVEKYKTGKYTLTTLGEEYDIDFKAVSYILNKFGDEDTKLVAKNNIARKFKG